MRVLVSLLALAIGGGLLAAPTAQAAGDAKAGEKVFAQCKTCHSLEAGKNMVGPSLAGVFGRKAGTGAGFSYSAAMKDSGIVWDEKTIDKYIENPKAFVPNNKMAFVGLKKPEQRADVIEYLEKALKK